MPGPSHHQGATAPPEPDDLYAGPPPWDIGRPQRPFLALAGEDRVAYVDGLRSATAPGGRCFLLCVSDRERGTWGRSTR